VDSEFSLFTFLILRHQTSSPMASRGNQQLTESSKKKHLHQTNGMVIVRTEWNAPVVDELENGCRKILEEKSIPSTTIVVPGAVEIPFAIKKYYELFAGGKIPEAFIALGCVIRGDTPHFDYVCQAVTQGITQLNIMLPVPTVFGILTVDDEQQAMERIGGKHGHKGEEAALTAIAMAALVRTLQEVNINP
jgi:6,7-dimethyl-8-ribityllumazine synthase